MSECPNCWNTGYYKGYGAPCTAEGCTAGQKPPAPPADTIIEGTPEKQRGFDAAVAQKGFPAITGDLITVYYLAPGGEGRTTGLVVLSSYSLDASGELRSLKVDKGNHVSITIDAKYITAVYGKNGNPIWTKV